jgi:hypothetical protein
VIVVSPYDSACRESQGFAFNLVPEADGQTYSLVCAKTGSSNVYSATTFSIVEPFHPKQTILSDIKNAKFLVKEVIEQNPNKELYVHSRHAWGDKYLWTTPTKGASYHVYLCPLNEEYCFRVIYGGMPQSLDFEIQSLKNKH